MTERYFFPALLALVFCFSFSAQAAAQGSGDRWDPVMSIQPGTKLIVDVDGAKPIKARFVRADSQTLTVKATGKQIDLPRREISAIYRGKRSSRVKPALIGALAGAGAGLLVGGAVIAFSKGDPLIGAGGFLIGMPVGAAIGAATGGGMKRGELIYSR